MTPRQWQIWKARPEGFERDHWFVIISGNERCSSERSPKVNGLACFTLRGGLSPTDVALDRADGFDNATTCQCDFLFTLSKTTLHSGLGSVSWERQQQIKAKLKEVFRI
jgi:hypothetical protein